MKGHYSIRAIKEIGKISANGVFIVDLTTNTFIYANRPFLKILETSKDSLIGKPLEMIRLLVREEREYIDRRMEELLSASKNNDIEVRMKINGTEKFICMDAFILNDKTLLMGMVKDITRAKAHAKYIVEFGARKDTLLDLVAHNLSGPLNITTTLLNKVDQLSKSHEYKKIDDHTRMIRENTQHCIEVINSFLREEHTQSQKIFFHKNRFDVLEKIRVIISKVEEFNIDKHIELVSDTDELIVSGDDVKFFQVIHNLISNAVKFTGSKGKIRVEVIDDETDFTIRISDNGIGIPEYLQPHLFKKSTPAAREGLKGEKSTGMGLYLSRRLTEIMQGDLSYETEENKGTSFMIRLPKE